MKQFKGRPVVAGQCIAPALVSHGGFNTLASFQGALQFGDLPVIGNKYKQTEYKPVEYPPTSEIMARLDELEMVIQKEMTELKGLL